MEIGTCQKNIEETFANQEEDISSKFSRYGANVYPQMSLIRLCLFTEDTITLLPYIKIMKEKCFFEM
jgi:hypothetical protein